jgi:pimeloyl-ACP methyl ester carboxylesterase
MQVNRGDIRFVDNKGVRIRYRVYGKGEPLVLLHGWPSEGIFWDAFGYVTPLSKDYQLIVPDLRGYGRSDNPADGDYSDRAYASDIRACMDDMGVKSAHVFDYWMSGYELAAGSPERVRSLVILGNHPYPLVRKNLDKWGSGEANRRFWEVDNNAPLPEEARERLAEWTPEQIRAVWPPKDDRSERLKAWKGPGLLIAGTHDDHMEGIKRFIASNSDWKLVMIESEPMTHGQVWIRSDLVLPIVQAFLWGVAHKK